MFLRIECPGCKAILQVEESLAGRQGKCIHCGHKIVVPGVPGASGPAAAPGPEPIQFLTEASPESMVRELHDRNKTAVLLVFEPGADGSYDLADVPDDKLKCIATEDITQARFAQIVASFSKRFAPRKPAPKVDPAGSSAIGRPTGEPIGPMEYFELKGDQLGMALADFKQKYARFTPDGRQDLPICSDQPGYFGKADLHSEAWHRRAGIIHARVDNPAGDNSPTIAGIKTDLLLYKFIDGKLFNIWAMFATDLFHVVSDAVLRKFGPPTREMKQPRQLEWENDVSLAALTRGTVHPRTASTLTLEHKELQTLAEMRMPQGESDI